MVLVRKRVLVLGVCCGVLRCVVVLVGAGKKGDAGVLAWNLLSGFAWLGS